ncbi:acyltransferase [Enterobacter cloacae]|uniref:acyltransferase family protein n=1 Tax=Enterobacter cloacae TaxID=550 RepID=UPI002541ABAE|nr:acyltransferase [Enterobacter cloacae]WIF61353.1 acyltransferase [Enterobacter cloacae]
MEIKNLQIVIAALLVVLTHFFGSELAGISSYFGHLGVDIFFTLSGFLMVYSQSEKKGPAKFFVGRVKRIYPAYIILSLPLLLLSMNSINPYMFLGNILLLPGFNDPKYTVVNYPAWTLVYEMIFYVLFAISLMVSRKRTLSCLITVTVIGISIYSFNGQYEKQGWVNLGYILGDPLMMNFAIGCLIGLAYSAFNVKNSINFYVFFVSFIFLIYFSLCILDNVRIIKLGIPSFMIIALAALSKPAVGILYKSLYTIGGASYSIYLSHLYFAKYSKEFIAWAGLNSVAGYAVLLTALIISIIFGVLFFKYVESPLSLKLSRKLTNTKAVMS